MHSSGTNLPAAPDLNPYVAKDHWCPSEQIELLCAALARSWGHRQRCPSQRPKQINRLDTTKKFNTAPRGHGNRAEGRLLEQVRRWHVTRQPFSLNVRTQRGLKPQFTAFNLFVTHTASAPARLLSRSREEFVPKDSGGAGQREKNSSLQAAFLL